MVNIKALSRQRAIYFGLFAGIFLPAVLLKILEHDFDLQFLTKLSILATVLIPLMAVVGFLTLLFHYRCPFCSSLWSYMEVEDNMINEVSQSYRIPYTKSNFVYKKEEHVVECRCTRCNNGKTRRKFKRIIERE